jgi:hypothetical protein
MNDTNKCRTKFTQSELKLRVPPMGLEPTIPGLGGRCLIRWATEAVEVTLWQINNNPELNSH